MCVRAIAALRRLDREHWPFATADVPDDRDLVFVSFVGEERGVGVRWALDHGFELDRAVVTEGSTGYSRPR